MKDLEIITVHYCTPEFIEPLVNSIREHEDNYPIRIIDGSDQELYKAEYPKICNRLRNVKLEQKGWNIHHGRGMDWGIRTSKHEWCLIIDSDNYLKQPIIDMLFVDKEIVGKNVKGYQRDGVYYDYYHPSFLLVNRAFYMGLWEKGAMFVHDGAPCWKFYRYIHDHKLDVCVDIFDHWSINYRDYIGGDGRGTRVKFNFKLRAGKDVF